MPTMPTASPCSTKILRTCLRSRAQRHQHGDIARAIGDRHRQHHQNIQSGDERDQADEKRGDQFFQAQRAKQRAIFVLPRGGRESPARRAAQIARAISSARSTIVHAKFEHAGHVAHAGQILRGGQRGETPSWRRNRKSRNRKSPATRKRRERGTMPKGVSCPSGLVSVT